MEERSVARKRIDRERSMKHNANKKARRENARRLTIQNEQANGIYTVKEDKRTYKQKLEERKNARKI
nr:MAG TPA: hypothetical protein [Caudoviricetes sp.]